MASENCLGSADFVHDIRLRSVRYYLTEDWKMVEKKLPIQGQATMMLSDVRVVIKSSV